MSSSSPESPRTRVRGVRDVRERCAAVCRALPRVSTVALDGLGERELLALAASAEKFSEHPIARAIVAAASEQGVAIEDPESFEAVPGAGVRVRVGGRSVLLGRSALLGEDAPYEDLDAARASHTRVGASVIALAVDGSGGPARRGGRAAPRGTSHRVSLAGARPPGRAGERRPTRHGGARGRRARHRRCARRGPARREGADRQDAAGAGSQRRVRGGRHQRRSGARERRCRGGHGLTGTDLALEAAQIVLLADELSNLPHLLGLSRQAIARDPARISASRLESSPWPSG